MSRVQVAERVFQAMAFDRKTFKDKTLGILSGAITHFYMSKLAVANRQTKWVQHWQTEVDRLINMDFVVAILTEIKGKWDKQKAIGETLADVEAGKHRYRTAAINYVTKVYKLKKIKKDLPEDVDEEFLKLVRDAVDEALSPSVDDD